MTPPKQLMPPGGTRVLRLALAALVTGLALMMSGQAVADDEASVDDVMMQVVEDPQADERDYVQDIEPPGVDRGRGNATDEDAAGEPRNRASERAPRTGSEARDGARAAREAAQQAREAAQDARGSASPQSESPPRSDPPSGGSPDQPDNSRRPE